jgi:hypothetical protein
LSTKYLIYKDQCIAFSPHDTELTGKALGCFPLRYNYLILMNANTLASSKRFLELKQETDMHACNSLMCNLIFEPTQREQEDIILQIIRSKCGMEGIQRKKKENHTERCN